MPYSSFRLIATELPANLIADIWQGSCSKRSFPLFRRVFFRMLVKQTGLIYLLIRSLSCWVFHGRLRYSRCKIQRYHISSNNSSPSNNCPPLTEFFKNNRLPIIVPPFPPPHPIAIFVSSSSSYPLALKLKIDILGNKEAFILLFTTERLQKHRVFFLYSFFLW